MKISLFTAEEKHLLTMLDVRAECFSCPLVLLVYFCRKKKIKPAHAVEP